MRLLRVFCLVTIPLLGLPASAAPGPSAQGATMNEHVGLNPGLGTLPLLTNARTRSISAENPTGAKGKGGTAIPDPTEPKPPAE